jgi:hypothetical protein
MVLLLSFLCFGLVCFILGNVLAVREFWKINESIKTGSKPQSQRTIKQVFGVVEQHDAYDPSKDEHRIMTGEFETYFQGEES